MEAIKNLIFGNTRGDYLNGSINNNNTSSPSSQRRLQDVEEGHKDRKKNDDLEDEEEQVNEEEEVQSIPQSPSESEEESQDEESQDEDEEEDEEDKKIGMNEAIQKISDKSEEIVRKEKEEVKKNENIILENFTDEKANIKINNQFVYTENQQDSDEKKEEEEYEEFSEIFKNTKIPFSYNVHKLIEMLVSKKNEEILSFLQKIPSRLMSQQTKQNELNLSSLAKKNEDLNNTSRISQIPSNFSDLAMKNAEQSEEMKKEKILKLLPHDIKTLYDIHKIYLSPYEELVYKEHFDFIDSNFWNFCLVNSTIQPSLKSLEERFVLDAKCMKMPYGEIHYLYEKDKTTLENDYEITINFSDILAKKNPSLSNVNSVWMIKIQFNTDNFCNFEQPFSVFFCDGTIIHDSIDAKKSQSFVFFPLSNKDFYSELPLLQNEEDLEDEEEDEEEKRNIKNVEEGGKEKSIALDIINEEKKRKLLPPPFGIVKAGSNIILPRRYEDNFDIKRSFLWSMYICGHSLDEIFSDVYECPTDPTRVVIKKTLQTYIVFETLFESYGLVPDNIYNIVKWIMSEGYNTLKLFKIKKKEFEDVKEFIQPFLKKQSFSNMFFKIRLFNNDSFKTLKTEPQNQNQLRIQLSFLIYYRQFMEKPTNQIINAIEVTRKENIVQAREEKMAIVHNLKEEISSPNNNNNNNSKIQFTPFQTIANVIPLETKNKQS
jgi:hypothetical protein